MIHCVAAGALRSTPGASGFTLDGDTLDALASGFAFRQDIAASATQDTMHAVYARSSR